MGHVPDAVSRGNAQLMGHHRPDDPVSIAVSLPLRNRAGLAQFLQSVNDPSSPQYHRYMSQDQVNQAFSPTPDEEQQVEQWLTSNGLTVTYTYANHLLVDARGTFGQVEKMLHVTINDYTATVHGRTRTFYAPAADPTVDGTVAAIVESIGGLDNYPRFHIFANGATDYKAPYYPQDFANAYDVNPLWNAGYIGTGQHIAITMWTVPPSDSTLQAFGGKTGANVATTANGRLKIITVDGGTIDSVSPDSGEAGMDIETSSGMAPGATIDYYEVATDNQGNPTDAGLEDALNRAGTDAYDNMQISNSWGGCEASSLSDQFTTAVEKIFATNEATGHNYFFSSGDNGSWCDPTGNGTGSDPYHDYQASSPNVTSVGGTGFTASINGGYPGENAWPYTASCSNGCPEGSGGGYSKIFSRPSWQTGSGLAANGMRGYPDISADASPDTGAYVCWGDNSSCGTIGGTSLASPLWAGMLADVNQYLIAQGRPTAGFINHPLYTMGTVTQPHAAFHDITSGNNGAYTAGPGWDACTGLGVPNGQQLLNRLRSR